MFGDGWGDLSVVTPQHVGKPSYTGFSHFPARAFPRITQPLSCPSTPLFSRASRVRAAFSLACDVTVLLPWPCAALHACIVPQIHLSRVACVDAASSRCRSCVFARLLPPSPARAPAHSLRTSPADLLVKPYSYDNKVELKTKASNGTVRPTVTSNATFAACLRVFAPLCWRPRPPHLRRNAGLIVFLAIPWPADVHDGR